MRYCCIPLLGLVFVGGCAVSTANNPAPLIPDQNLVIASGPAGKVPVGAALLAGAMYWYYDPLAPNWTLRETYVGQYTYTLFLEMKRFNTGGDGEALPIIRRRAQELQQQTPGIRGHRLENIRQGIESHVLGARRYAEATIILIPELPLPTPVAPKALVEPSQAREGRALSIKQGKNGGTGGSSKKQPSRSSSGKQKVSSEAALRSEVSEHGVMPPLPLWPPLPPIPAEPIPVPAVPVIAQEALPVGESQEKDEPADYPELFIDP